MQFDEIEQDENVNSQNITMKDPTEVSWFHPVKVSDYSQFATILDCILYVFDKYLSNITNFVNVLVFWV